jgi:outer membrane biosynthesis protein TonB
MGGYHSAAFLRAAFLAGALAACAGDDRESAVGAARNRPPTSEQMRAATGLSHLPIPADQDAFNASMLRHYPPALLERKVGGAVLVDLDIDERGFVENVDVVNRPATPDVKMVLIDKDASTGAAVEREVELSYDPAFGPAAQAAMREVRFEPALKDGLAVPFKMRMTITFEPPAR